MSGLGFSLFLFFVSLLILFTVIKVTKTQLHSKRNEYKCWLEYAAIKTFESAWVLAMRWENFNQVIKMSQDTNVYSNLWFQNWSCFKRLTFEKHMEIFFVFFGFFFFWNRICWLKNYEIDYWNIHKYQWIFKESIWSNVFFLLFIDKIVYTLEYNRNRKTYNVAWLLVFMRKRAINSLFPSRKSYC